MRAVHAQLDLENTSTPVHVESACIASVAFSFEENVLQLEFRNGLPYKYFGVSAAVYTNLLSAQSKGAFVTRFIRGHFPFRRLNQPCDLTQ